VNTTTLSWTIALFFGGSIVFAAIRRLTDDAGWGVTLLAQLGALALIIAVIVLVVRRNSRDEHE
jgi:DMSO reductase anchor subunit